MEARESEDIKKAVAGVESAFNRHDAEALVRHVDRGRTELVSTFALQLCREHRAVRLTLDDWMARLFGQDERPAMGRLEWYVERRDRCIELIWKLTKELIGVGTNVVLEIGLIQQRDREEFYARVDQARMGLTVYVIDAPRELRRERVQRRNQEKGETFSMEVPPHFFELASDMWEPPQEDECLERDVRFPLSAGEERPG